jgi:hypothetical protein
MMIVLLLFLQKQNLVDACDALWQKDDASKEALKQQAEQLLQQVRAAMCGARAARG